MSATGRPSSYDPKYCDMLINHMEQGLSIEAFGGVVRVAKKTLYNWMKEHPEFLEAKEIGESLTCLYWEKIARDGMYSETIKDDSGQIITRAPAASILIFNLKNRLGWRDKHDVTGDFKIDEHKSQVEELKTKILTAIQCKTSSET